MLPRPSDYAYEPPAQVGARHYLRRILHLTLNVSDLERSAAFYESLLHVKRCERIDGPGQPFLGLGVAEGRFEGWVLRDGSEYPSRALHLISWKDPAASGTGYAESNHVGFYRFETLLRQSGVREAYRRASDLGGRPYGPLGYTVLDDKGGRGGPVFTLRDPDGISVEMSNEPAPPDGRDRFHHVAMNCRDLATSYAFYRDIVGLDFYWLVAPGPQPVNTVLGDTIRSPDGSPYDADVCERDALLMTCRGDDRTPFNLVHWRTPAPYGSPYSSPLAIGIQSVAFEVDDIALAYGALARGLARRPDQLCGPPERWDLGDAGRWWVVNFFDPDGARLQLWQADRPGPAEPIPPLGS